MRIPPQDDVSVDISSGANSSLLAVHRLATVRLSNIPEPGARADDPARSFPPPKIFTNALLAPHDITALIRDTEPHERALFSVPPPPPPTQAYQDPKTSTTSNRRQTVFNVASGEVTSGAGGPSARAPRRNTAVAAVLGGDLHSRIRRSEAQTKGELDVEVLLHGAEKLGGVYPVPGAAEKIQMLRGRYGQLRTNIRHYEERVATQTKELERMNRSSDWDHDDGDLEEEEVCEVTEEDLRAEEEEIRELEAKKKALEERVSGMERDLGGLMR